MSKGEDFSGKIFGRLTTLSEVEDYICPRGKRYKKWLCLCECGRHVQVRQIHLNNGHTKSCGCLHKEAIKKAVTKTGLSTSKVYNIWSNMRARCNNPKNVGYYLYGGRGITYDPKWETFEGFWEDMEDGYEDSLSLDRIDNNKGYYKSNCR